MKIFFMPYITNYTSILRVFYNCFKNIHAEEY